MYLLPAPWKPKQGIGMVPVWYRYWFLRPLSRSNPKEYDLLLYRQVIEILGTGVMGSAYGVIIRDVQHNAFSAEERDLSYVNYAGTYTIMTRELRICHETYKSYVKNND
jgi:hypothetical protein